MGAFVFQGLPVLPVGVSMNTQAVEHDEVAFLDLSVTVVCTMINGVAWSLNSVTVVSTLSRHMNFVQFRYWWDWVEAVPFIENIEVSVSQGVICTGKLWDHADLSEYMYTHVMKSTIQGEGVPLYVGLGRSGRENKEI